MKRTSWPPNHSVLPSRQERTPRKDFCEVKREHTAEEELPSLTYTNPLPATRKKEHAVLRQAVLCAQILTCTFMINFL